MVLRREAQRGLHILFIHSRNDLACVCVILGLVVERQWSISGRPSPRAPHMFGGGIACDGAGDLAFLSLDYGSEQVDKLELIRRKLEGGLTVPEAQQ